MPLVIAANRDEYYRRHASPPAIHADLPEVIAGRDSVKGGSWMGCSKSGFFVGLTNQRTWHAADPTLRSRGEIVLSCLRDNHLEAVVDRLSQLDTRKYSPFNLMFGNYEKLLVAYVRQEPPYVTFQELNDHITVLANDVIGSKHFPKANRLAQLLNDPQLGSLGWPNVQRRLTIALSDHCMPDSKELEDPPAGSLWPKFMVRKLQALCIHTPVYGTVSASIIATNEQGLAHYHYANGCPCENSFSSVL